MHVRRMIMLVSWSVLVTASPAAATTTAVVSRPWHYWAAPILAASFVLLALALGVGYFVRVLNPKHGFVRLPKR